MDHLNIVSSLGVYILKIAAQGLWTVKYVNS